MSNELIYAPEHKDFLQRFVSEGIWGRGTHKTFDDNSVFLAVANETDGVIAGIVYHYYNPDHGTIEMSGFTTKKHWLSRNILNKILEYPFNQLKLRLVFCRFSGNNRFIANIVERLGGTVHILPDMCGEGESQMFGILKRDNWYKSELYNGRT